MCEQQTSDLLPVTDTLPGKLACLLQLPPLSSTRLDIFTPLLLTLFLRPFFFFVWCAVFFFSPSLKLSFYFILHFLCGIYSSPLHGAIACLNFYLIVWQLILLPEDVSQDVASFSWLVVTTWIFLWKLLWCKILLKAPPVPQKGSENASPAQKHLY